MPTPDRPSARRPRSLLWTGGLFVVVSVVCGLLVTGLTLPLVGGAAWGAKAARDGMSSLPLEFDAPAQSQRTRVLDADGRTLAYFYDQNRDYVSLDDIAPVMRTALISIEDHRFYEHGPLDAQGTLRAFVTNFFAGGVTQGGSTLTQQYVKQVQVNTAALKGDENGVEAATDSSYQRKLRELRYAVSVEDTMSKDQILERYLNIAYFGGGAYGVEAAAEHYFGTSAKKLTLPQAAMLAGLVQNPNGYDPVAHPDAGLARRNVVLDRMAELGTASQSAVTKAKKAKFDRKGTEDFVSGCQSTDYPFICDYVKRSLLTMPSLGKTPAEREQTLMRGGLTIRTAIDPDTQDEVQKEVSAAVGPKDPVIAAMDMIEPGTGRIVAMAQSRPVMGSNAKKGQTYWNYSVSREMGGAQGFQAGSTFKAFTAAAALEQGIPLSQRFDARARMDFTGARFDSCDGPMQLAGRFPVSNSTGVNGTMDMYRAAQFSVNTYFVQLALDVGMCDITKMASKLGVESNTPDQPISSYDTLPSFTLGTAETNPLSVANAYATFASGGIHCDPVIVTKITDSAGKSRDVPDGDCKRVISTDVASAMDSLLSSVVTKGTGARARTDDGRPQAGKTGTIDSNAAVWYAGYTPQISGAAMISIDKERGSRTSLKGYTVPSTGLYLEGSGSGDAGRRIWKPAMEEYLKGKPAESFPSPPADLVRGPQQGGPDRFGPGGGPQPPGGR
ncbi:Membrane carboxypeptidase (penicillin-binding protein) [Microlunatus flavus]|uniref:Membrane carboxypeptidase (Penicillin-binding protein) n=1 Tax=Microlunatus flavus TaxID=1036181 RepID=A0A1H9G7I2_9ACTN|nr:transglycosylase domain-containing protein [Microlunatus flavus]SEQ46067.1 Membrane carboxypeptidase (penicillin-binding protein) [Microlunatus flavus]